MHRPELVQLSVTSGGLKQACLLSYGLVSQLLNGTVP
jgi:hypothetical protein